MDWFRSYHGAPTDTKWLAIAAKAQSRPGVVACLWWALMDHASQSKPKRGTVETFDLEGKAAFFGWPEDEVQRVVAEFTRRGMIGPDGELRNWSKRNPGDFSTERVRRFRENHKYVETGGNGTKRSETQRRGEESRGDKKETATEVTPPKLKKKRNGALPADWKPNETHRRIAGEEGVDLEREVTKYRDHATATGRTLADWDAGFCTWLRKAGEFAKASPRPSVRNDFGDETARDAGRQAEARKRQSQREAEQREADEEQAERDAAELASWWQDLDADTRAAVEREAKERCKSLPKGLHRSVTAGVMVEYRRRENIPLPLRTGGSSA